MPQQSAKIPSPTKGLNNRDNIAMMEPGYAIVLDNIIPEESSCVSRCGIELYSDLGVDDHVETVMAYTGKTQNLFACVLDKIYDITEKDQKDVSLDGRKSAQNNFLMFQNDGGQNFLYVVNGDDVPTIFDGKEWSFPSMNPLHFNQEEKQWKKIGLEEDDDPLPLQNLFAVEIHNSRLFFLEKNSLNFYFLNTLSIAGDLKKFPLGMVFKRGGSLVGMGSWTRDGRGGMENMLCFFTDQGEVALYSGDDPADVQLWGLSGLFNIGVIAGTKREDYMDCSKSILKVGADLFIITKDGLISMGAILSSGFSLPSMAISDAISGFFSESVEEFGEYYGWQAMQYNSGGLLIVNVPEKIGKTQIRQYVQYVMNITNKSWCRFTDLNVFSWIQFKNDLYCGMENGKIGIYNKNYFMDFEKSIHCRMITSYSDFGIIAKKMFQILRPYIKTHDRQKFYLSMDVDFRQMKEKYRSTLDAGIISKWDVDKWDECKWSLVSRVLAQNIMIVGTGINAAVYCYFMTTNEIVRIYCFDASYQSGSFL